MSEISFLCPECGQKVAVDTNGLGFDLACPHCGKTVPVPWESVSSEAQSQTSGSESAAAPRPSLIPQVLPLRDYDSSQCYKLVSALLQLSAYSKLSEWNREAKEEQGRINEAFLRINDALQPLDETITNLSLELDRVKSEFKEQSFLKRISADRREERVITAQIADIQSQRARIESEKSRLIKMMDYLMV